MVGFPPDLAQAFPRGRPGPAQAIGQRLAEKGIEFVDAPVSGGETGAINAALTIMVGGKPEAFEKVKPLFEKMGKSVTLIGASGAGQVAKACNQMLMVNVIQACAEALRLAGAHGLDAGKVVAALAGGSAGSRVLDVMGGRMARRDFVAGIQARLHHKDFAILMDEARQLGAPLPVAVHTWQQLNALMGLGGAQLDTSSLLRVLDLDVMIIALRAPADGPIGEFMRLPLDVQFDAATVQVGADEIQAMSAGLVGARGSLPAPEAVPVLHATDIPSDPA